MADGEQLAKMVETGPRDFRIGFLVHDVSRMRRTLFDQEMKPLGITRSQWWALAQLSRSGDNSGMPQTELARVMEVGKATIGGPINRLEDGGFLRRTSDASDRRSKRVVITSKGRDTLHKMEEIGRQLNLRILRAIKPQDVALAERVLNQIKENIRDIPGDLDGTD